MRIIYGDPCCSICGGPLHVPYWQPPTPEENAAVIACLVSTRATAEKNQGTKEFENSEARGNDHQIQDSDDESSCELPSKYDPRVLSSYRDDRLKWLDHFRAVGRMPEEYGRIVPE
jgi:hypothetical protein